MSAFNAIGGIIFGTIALSIVWFIIMAFVKESNNDKSNTDGTWIVVMSFAIMVMICLVKCSDK